MNSSLSIEERITAIKQTLPEGVRLVAVSKFQSSEAIVQAYEAGQRVFGESRVQELIAKYDELGPLYLDLCWHFIGPLQSNKVKYIAPFINMIESVTSEKLLQEINRQAIKNQRCIDILLEVHIAQEETKGGLNREELFELLRELRLFPDKYRGVRIRGLMMMASNTSNEEQVEREFAALAHLMQDIKGRGLVCDVDVFDELSMGMSNDYHLALKQGATLVRLGSAVFGV